LNRKPRTAAQLTSRERLKHDFTRASPMRELHPRLAELRVALEFQDQVTPSPSPQSFSYFPAARGFFRYSCPCHTCSGEIDLSSHVADLAGKPGDREHTRRVSVLCMGQRILDRAEPVRCPITVQIVLSAVVRSEV
jgi:hypothetical protein